MTRARPLDRLHNLPLPEPSLIALAGGLLAQRLRPWRLPGSRRAQVCLGAPMLVAGSHLIVRSTRAAGAVDLERPGTLVTTGPYATVRNPMYIGWTLLQAGCGFVVGSWWVLTALPPAAVVLHREVLREERRLRAIFGPEYQDYCAIVPRYVPAIGERRTDRAG